MPPAGPLPDLRTLTRRLGQALSAHGARSPEVKILRRRRNVYASTYPTEVIACRLADGRELELFCKYGPATGDGRGRPRGVAYEAAVYTRLLEGSPLPTAELLGVWEDLTSGECWLFLQHLDGSRRMSQADFPEGVVGSARWLGQFHAWWDARSASEQPSFLRRHDASFYRRWARRTAAFAGHWHWRHPWLAELCDRYEDAVPHLFLSRPPSVVHGDYYAENLLIRDVVVYPVDWELSALAAAEIDLASLLDHWPPDIADQCEREYARARWPMGPPPDFQFRMTAARLHLHFRWLGHRPDWTERRKCAWRFRQLWLTARELGLLPARISP